MAGRPRGRARLARPKAGDRRCGWSSKRVARSRRREHFVGIEDALGVEQLLDAMHQFQGRRRNFTIDEVPFFDADAVFPGQRALKFQYQIENPLED